MVCSPSDSRLPTLGPEAARRRPGGARERQSIARVLPLLAARVSTAQPLSRGQRKARTGALDAQTKSEPIVEGCQVAHRATFSRETWISKVASCIQHTRRPHETRPTTAGAIYESPPFAFATSRSVDFITQEHAVSVDLVEENTISGYQTSSSICTPVGCEPPSAAQPQP